MAASEDGHRRAHCGGWRRCIADNCLRCELLLRKVAATRSAVRYLPVNEYAGAGTGLLMSKIHQEGRRGWKSKVLVVQCDANAILYLNLVILRELLLSQFT